MAGGLDRLERRLDKLERFFKRKGSAGGTVSGASSPRKSDSIFRTFPQPSFIRPTSTRMLARDEASLNLRPTRAHSLPETPSTPRLMSLTSSNEGEASPGSQFSTPRQPAPGLSVPPRIPKRSSSLSPTRRPASLASLAELLEFSFANSHRESDTMKPTLSRSRPRSGSISPTGKTGRRRRPNKVDGQSRAPNIALTPPPSAEYDKTFGSAQLALEKELPAVPPPNELTPRPSPRLVPLPEPRADEFETNLDVGIQRPKSLDASSTFSKEARVALRKSLSFSTLVELRSSKLSPILKEPTLSDFMSLSDDDIADGALPRIGRSPTRLTTVSKPPTCGLPPDPPVLASSPQISAGTRLLTLSPPLATRPATAAAFEAARIAAKYKFDLVYVVNLWPSGGLSRNNSVFEHASPSVEPGPDESSADQAASPTSRHTKVALTGRLLAAYGLHSVMSPFRISAPVHLKMLRSNGWLEYRCENGAPDEFCRGYSCSFYTGHSSPDSSRGRSMGEDSPDTKQNRRRGGTAPNRGVVFAAYRLPRAAAENTDTDTDIDSDAAELEALRVDAETLVNMLIDIHMTQRKHHHLQRRGAPLTSSPRCFDRRNIEEASGGGGALLAV
ncbi:hypothetical protein QBC47DRAFT_296235 [Echria macrotheca]|uniref:Uncharacterized protein n=1 Tax=Echria macrotheca TaxID=438768 RepID=A0AAJ0BLA2_9PEZI|nr:hypothetical protein QBC47DRAFT_296235 [Echria macrotheca]